MARFGLLQGIKAGSENGRRGYFMTYMIAYLRDYGMRTRSSMRIPRNTHIHTHTQYD
jgi:hypothetical protein